MEIDLQKSLTGNSAVAILQNKELREYNTGTGNVTRDSVDKRISDLANGTNSNAAELADADNINIPRNNVTLEVPQMSNSLSYTGTGGTSGNSRGNTSYSSVPAIKGTALDQATGLLKKFEGFSDKAYWDVNAYRTGYGSDTITKADGTIVKVTKDTVVSRADAERDLARRTQEFANRARNNVSSSTWDKLPPNAQAALTSYAYNYGSLTKDVIAAAQASAQSGDMNALANAVRNRQNNNNGVNAKRRNQEADYILGK